MNTSSFARRLNTYAIALICVAALVVNSPLVLQGAVTAVAAGGSVLSLSPSTGTYGIGQTFTANITLNTNGEAINAVEADLSFPADKLEVTKAMDYTTGGVLMFALDNSYDNATGQIRLAGGLFSPGFAGTVGHVATITFHAKAAGVANVSFNATSAVLRNADNANVLTGTQPGQFTISDAAGTPGGLMIAPPMLSCTEGAAAAFSVSLGSAPKADVSVTLVGDPQVVVSPGALSFTPGTWNTAQSVVVTAVDDSMMQGTRTVMIHPAVTSADAAYQGLVVAPELVTIFDNDVAPTGHTVTASVSGTGGTISPNGAVAIGPGASLRFVITPDAGSEIDTLSVDGATTPILDRALMMYDFKGVSADHTIVCSFRAQKDTTAPTLTLTGLSPEGAPRVVTGTMPWSLAIHATDDRGPTSVNVTEGSATLATASVNGDASLPVTVPDGTHQLVVSAADAAGNVTSRQIQLVVDTTGPAISLPSVPVAATSSPFTLSGHVTDTISGVASLTVGGSTVQLSADGGFSYVASLTKGSNRIDVEAVDKLGNKSAHTVTITYAPALTIVLKIGSPFMTVGGQKVSIDASGKVAPVIQNGRTLLPIRALIETLGGTVDWDAAARKATIRLKGKTLQLWIGKSTATVNGRTTRIDSKDAEVMPAIVQGRTLLPLRFVAENLGLDLVWDASQRTVTLTTDGS